MTIQIHCYNGIQYYLVLFGHVIFGQANQNDLKQTLQNVQIGIQLNQQVINQKNNNIKSQNSKNQNFIVPKQVNTVFKKEKPIEKQKFFSQQQKKQTLKSEEDVEHTIQNLNNLELIIYIKYLI